MIIYDVDGENRIEYGAFRLRDAPRRPYSNPRNPREKQWKECNSAQFANHAERRALAWCGVVYLVLKI